MVARALWPNCGNVHIPADVELGLMPRKKPEQPVPIEKHTYDFDDGESVEVEIYEDGEWPIGRGLANQHRAAVRDDQICTRIVDDYLKKGRKAPKYLRSPTAFAKQMDLWGLPKSEELSDSNVRKVVYPRICTRLQALGILPPA